MKKISQFCAFCFVLSALSPVFAYTSDDVATANALATADIIVDHSNKPRDYNLDTTITRAEVIGMSLKLKGIALPANYACKGYFTDANFKSTDPKGWMCRAVELASDRGLITRENTTTRPNDTITKAEALAIIWKAAGFTIEDAGETDGIFVDPQGLPANEWQEDLLQTALKMNVITPNTLDGNFFWKHNNNATRKEVFALVSRLLGLKKAIDLAPTLIFSGEVRTRIVSTDAALVKKLTEKDFTAVMDVLDPKPIQFRTEGNMLFVMQKMPDKWGHVVYSGVSAIEGKIIQRVLTYNPYEKAMKAMLAKFKLASEADFYAIPYGDLWEQTRDFIEAYFIDEFENAKILYPQGSTIVP